MGTGVRMARLKVPGGQSAPLAGAETRCGAPETHDVHVDAAGHDLWAVGGERLLLLSG